LGYAPIVKTVNNRSCGKIIFEKFFGGIEK
jgi:hypothetical protein